MEVAAERGHKDILHYLRDANSDVNIGLYRNSLFFSLFRNTKLEVQ